jgi:hypothetical protein
MNKLQISYKVDLALKYLDSIPYNKKKPQGNLLKAKVILEELNTQLIDEHCTRKE